MKQKYFAAIHVITESSDHYNFLIQYDTINNAAAQIADSLDEEIEYVSDIFVTTNQSEDACDKIIKSIYKLTQD